MSGPPSITGLLETAIYVEDVDRAVRFYEQVLGLDVLDRDERLTAMNVSNRHVLLVCLRGASLNRPKGPHDARGSQHVAFAVPAGDLPRWQARLAEHQVAIEEIRPWPRGGRSLYFRDPDGHLLELASPGVWSIY
jgi:catechol 2,3-dioxygenase-like lactoylglutathione lyase family enzyme